MIDDRVVRLIADLELGPHPEGGYFREVFRSDTRVRPADGRPERSALTIIHFLLSAGQFSRWHRVRSDEVWHFCEGDPLELLVAAPDLVSIDRIRLGLAGASDSGRADNDGSSDPTEAGLPPSTVAPFHTVPAGFWQAARPLGAYSLVSCAVAPGFDFDDFAFLREDAAALAGMKDRHPALATFA